MSSTNLKKLNLSIEAIKNRFQASEPNLSHSLINTGSLKEDAQMHQTDFARTSLATHPSLIAILPLPDPPSPKKKAKRRSSSPRKDSNQNARITKSFSPKFLTSIKTQSIPCNSEGKAMTLLSFLCAFHSIHIRIFHISWIALFVSFLTWFSLIELTATELNLSSTHQTIATGIQYLSTAIFSVIFGDLCDKMGARYCYILLFIISVISLILLILFAFNPISYICFSFFVGISGASFVITQYHINSFFSSKCVGLTNALGAGFGIFTAGIVANALPPFGDMLQAQFNIPSNIKWRIALLIPISLLFIMIFVYYFFTIDSPKGNISRENINIIRIVTLKKYKCKRILSDYRIWILSLTYCLCFGSELTILNYFMQYISYTFNEDIFSTKYILFGLFALNVFGRACGGYISDLLYFKYGIQGRVYCLFWALLFESLFLFVFANSSFDFGYSVLMIVFFVFYCQIAEGIVFAIVSNLPHQLYIGLCMGIVAGGGPIGAVFGSCLFGYVPHPINYQTAWIVCSVFVLIASFSIWFVRFTEKEINDDLKNVNNDYWTSVGTKFRSNTVVNGDTNSPGFVIH